MVRFTPAARVAALPPNFWGEMDAEIARLSALPGPAFIDVSKGNPDLPTPEAIVDEMRRAVAEPANHRYPSYAPRRGFARAVADAYARDHDVRLDPETQVAVFHGSHEALMAGVLALADPGDAVVVPDPGYPLYRSAIELAGAREVVLPLDESTGYQPAFDALGGLASAALVLLNYPNNPTGALATPATFAGALGLAERTGAALLHDFAYSSLGFDGRTPLSALAIDRDAERTVEAQTLSKTYSMAGWRVGFAAGNASAIAAMRRYQSHAFSTMFGASQDAAAAALSGDQSAARELVAEYERRRDLVVAGLVRSGWEVIAPEGTFFVWVRLPARPDGSAPDAVALAARLREAARVGVAPGDGFGERGRGHIRLGLVQPEPVLRELVERLAPFAGAGIGA